MRLPNNTRAGSKCACIRRWFLNESPIAKVGGAYNAVQIVGDACGDIMLYGKGAGSLPTGSAVVADIMDISRGILNPGSLSSPAAAPANRGVPATAAHG